MPPRRRRRRSAARVAVVVLALVAVQGALAAPPAPEFTISPAVPQIDQVVTFTSAATDPDGDAVAVQWDFQDDGTFDAAGDSAQHAYSTPGDKTVRMRVTDVNGEVAERTKTLRVNAPPRAAIAYSPEMPTVGDPVELDASGSGDRDGSIAAYEWDLDDDGDFDAQGQTVVRTFASAGRNAVRLRVTDDDGATELATRRVFVNAPPNADFTFSAPLPSPGGPEVGQQLSFDAASSSDPDGSIEGYDWDLDNNGRFDAQGRAVLHAFASTGEKTVRLLVTDAYGRTDTATLTLRVKPR
jgi:PKD repeat protein